MIENNDQLIQAIEQMGRMQKMVESFQRDILPQNPKNFALFAEGPIDEIGKLQNEINAYLARIGASSDTPAALREEPRRFGEKA